MITMILNNVPVQDPHGLRSTSILSYDKSTAPPPQDTPATPAIEPTPDKEDQE